MKFALIAAALAGTTNAWFGKGHLLVAHIARNILEKSAPDQLEKYESIISILEESDPKLT